MLGPIGSFLFGSIRVGFSPQNRPVSGLQRFLCREAQSHIHLRYPVSIGGTCAGVHFTFACSVHDLVRDDLYKPCRSLRMISNRVLHRQQVPPLFEGSCRRRCRGPSYRKDRIPALHRFLVLVCSRQLVSSGLPVDGFPEGRRCCFHQNTSCLSECTDHHRTRTECRDLPPRQGEQGLHAEISVLSGAGRRCSCISRHRDGATATQAASSSGRSSQFPPVENRSSSEGSPCYMPPRQMRYSSHRVQKFTGCSL